MKTSVIDIGTKSIKHFIFNGKKQVYFNRDSSIKIGIEVIKTKHLSESGIKKAMEYIKDAMEINKEKGVEKTIILGTDALRKAENSNEFIDILKEETGINIQIISHEEEATLLGKAFLGLVKGDYAAVDTGGGSTEVVICKDGTFKPIMVPFGVDRVYQEFFAEDYSKGIYDNLESWKKAEEFLNQELDKVFPSDIKVDKLFLAGVLDFLMENNNLIGMEFQKNDMAEHPIKMSVEEFREYMERLKKIGVRKLAENSKKDPGYADNFAIGQLFYLSVAEKLDAKIMYPGEFQYVQGLVN